MDDFGEILKKWENTGKSGYIDKDEILLKYQKKEQPKIHRIKDLKKMKIQESLDLHGLTVSEAETELGKFIFESKKKGLRKVLIIHGKGYHSKKEPVLKSAVSKFLSDSPYTGMTGTPDQSHGGSGAVWVIIK